MTQDTPSKTASNAPSEYRERPEQFIQPTPEELKARGRRSIAIAVALAAFMIFVFVTMITRGS